MACSTLSSGAVGGSQPTMTISRQYMAPGTSVLPVIQSRMQTLRISAVQVASHNSLATSSSSSSIEDQMTAIKSSLNLSSTRSELIEVQESQNSRSNNSRPDLAPVQPSVSLTEDDSSWRSLGTSSTQGTAPSVSRRKVRTGRNNSPEEGKDAVRMRGSRMWVLTDNGWVMRKFLSRPGARAERLTKEEMTGAEDEHGEPAVANQHSMNVMVASGTAEADVATVPVGESEDCEGSNSTVVNHYDSDSDGGDVEVSIGTFGLLEQRCGLVDTLAGSEAGSGMAMSLEVDGPQNVMAGWEVEGDEGGEEQYAAGKGGRRLSSPRGTSVIGESGMASLESLDGASTITPGAAASGATVTVSVPQRVSSAVVVAVTSDPAPIDSPNSNPTFTPSSRANDKSGSDDVDSGRATDEPCDVSFSPPRFSASAIASPISPRPARSLLAWTAADEPRVEPFRRLKINLDLDVWRAKRLFRRGRRAEAQRLMEKAIRDWPDDGRPYVVLARLLQRQGRVREARRVLEDGCSAVGGDNAFIWQTWAMLEVQCGNIDSARKLFDAALVADERHVAAWHGWAVLELREGHVKKARELLEKGLKLCGANEYILQTLAVMEARSGRVEEARSLFSQATRTSQGSAATWLAWALLEAQQGEVSAARHFFQRALEVSPKNRYAWQAWGLFEASQGRYERSRLLLRRGCQLNPRDPALLQASALVEYEMGAAGTARELFRQAARVDPNHQPVWTAWAWMEWKEGEADVARSLYKRAADIDSVSPNAARVFQAWGVLEEREGNVGLARALFRRAIQADANNSVAWRSWAAMEERQGNAVRADELRSMRMQQRTEVVEPASVSWDLGGFIAPAIDRMKQLFRAKQTAAATAAAAASSYDYDYEYQQQGQGQAGASQSNSSGGGGGGGSGYPKRVLSEREAAANRAAGWAGSQASGEVNRWEEGEGEREMEGEEDGEGEEEEDVFDVDGFLRTRLPAEFERIGGLSSERAWRR